MMRSPLRPLDSGAAGWLRVVGALVLLLLVFLAVPLASANPVDPTWTPGLYDNADYDDVTLVLVCPDGWLEATLPSSAPVPTVARSVPLEGPAGPPTLAPAPLPEIRAPPA